MHACRSTLEDPTRIGEGGDRAVLELAMGWKSEQYTRTGHWDAFSLATNRELFFELQARGLLAIHTLHAGDRCLALHAGVVHEGRFYYWLPAHDPDAQAYSPGSLLLEHLIRTSYEQRWSFDFLLGNEPYKWHFATHSRLVGPIGQEALAVRGYRQVRRAATAALRRHEGTYKRLRAIKLAWKSRGWV